MLQILFTSSLIGLIIGMLYGACFISSLKKFFSGQKDYEFKTNSLSSVEQDNFNNKNKAYNIDKKQILKLILFYISLHLLLIGIFVLLIFKTKANIIVTLPCFTISFWYYILVKTKTKNK